MWNLWKAVSLGIPLAAALAVPDTLSAGPADEPGQVLPPTLDQYGSAPISFQIRCPAGLQESAGVGDDEYLEFKFSTAPNTQDCVPENILINDRALEPFERVTGPTSNGAFHGHGSRSDSGAVDIVTGLWTLNCPAGLDSASEKPHAGAEEPSAPSFSLSITSVNGKVVSPGSGFEIAPTHSEEHPSIKVLDTLTRLETSIPRESYLNASESTGVNETPKVETSVIEHEIKELRYLIAEAERIQNAIKTKQQFIAQSTHYAVAEGYAKCHGLSCVKQGILIQFKDIAAGTRGAAKALCNKLSSGYHQANSGDQSVNKAAFKIPAAAEKAFKSDTSVPEPSSTLSASFNETRSYDELSDSTGSAPQTTSKVPGPVTTSPAPSTIYRSQNPISFWISKAIIIGLLLPSLVLPFCLVVCLRRRCSQQRRQERRWIRETRRNARAVRRAHRKQAWQAWWQGLWHPRATADYEEKRSHIVSQENVLEDAMQAEIRSLRSAAELVSSLVSAEEGSSRYTHPTTSSSTRNNPTPTTSATTATTRADSLPDYTSEGGYSEPPPTYQDNDVSDLSRMVVDGFQYVREHTPSPTELWTPSTSVLSPSESSQDGGSDDELSKD